MLAIFLKIWYNCKEAIGASYNGSTPVSKTVNVGSIPTAPAILNYGEYGEVVNTADCGSVTRGFESHYSPHSKFIDLLFRRFFYFNRGKLYV